MLYPDDVQVCVGATIGESSLVNKDEDSTWLQQTLLFNELECLHSGNVECGLLLFHFPQMIAFNKLRISQIMGQMKWNVNVIKPNDFCSLILERGF